MIIIITSGFVWQFRILLNSINQAQPISRPHIHFNHRYVSAGMTVHDNNNNSHATRIWFAELAKWQIKWIVHKLGGIQSVQSSFADVTNTSHIIHVLHWYMLNADIEILNKYVWILSLIGHKRVGMILINNII